MRELFLTLLISFLMVAPLSLAAAPVGYSINSDSPTGNADSLYRIDLSSGTETRVAAVSPAKIDVEGLAFAADGTLYAVDDDAMTLFPLDPANGLVDTSREVFISGLPAGGQNDFGMTFACDGNLYVTSIARGSLYRMNLNGQTTVVGAEGSLNPVKISAIAAYGDPVQLYGLGSGADAEGNTDSPSLFRIDLATGTVAEIGPLGEAAGPYLQGGLSFDAGGRLWAITEGAQFGWNSQAMKIDTQTGAASAVQTLNELGFESLAISPPAGCNPVIEPPLGNEHSAYAGVPTLNQSGLALAAILLLLAGLAAVRRL